jgi:Transcription antiterminator
MAKRWYVAKLKPGGLAKAEVNLARQRFESAMPRLRLSRRRGHRYEDQLKPLFPGYIFVSFDADRDRWQPINSTLGIAYLLTDERARPTPMPAKFVEALSARCEDGQVYVPAATLAVGDTVEVMTGPFTGLIGKIESLSEAGRVRLLLEVLGRATRAELPGASLDVVAR